MCLGGDLSWVAETGADVINVRGVACDIYDPANQLSSGLSSLINLANYGFCSNSAPVLILNDTIAFVVTAPALVSFPVATIVKTTVVRPLLYIVRVISELP